MIIILLIVVAVGLYVWHVYNTLQTYKTYVDEAASQIDVQLKRRFDLIPNLVETVKGYASHESETLEKVIAARNAGLTADSIPSKLEANNQVTQALGHLFALSENYPNLKANENFLRLQEELTNTENKVSFARQHYNSTVQAYNKQLVIFPSNLIANMMHLQAADYLEAEEAEKQAPKVKF